MLTGMEQIIAPPPLRKRPWGLFTDVAYQIDLDVSRLAAGVTFTPLGTDPVEAIDAEFCDDTPGEDDASGGTIPVFEAFSIRASESCSALDIDLAWLNGRIEQRWGATISAALAAEAATGAHSGASPTFATEADVDATVATADTVISRAEALLSAKLHGAQGVVHVTPETFGAIAEFYLEFTDGKWFTPGGHEVIADPGYDGAYPDGESAPDAGEAWVFTTGPVGHRYGPPRLVNQGANEYLDRTRNDVHGRKVADAVVAFDPATVSAFLVDLGGTGS